VCVALSPSLFFTAIVLVFPRHDVYFRISPSLRVVSPTLTNIMDEFLIWDESLTYAYFTLFGNKPDDLNYLLTDGRFSPCSQQCNPLDKVVYNTGVQWLTGYFMKEFTPSSSPKKRKILVQRAYGKLNPNPSNAVVANRNKFIICDASDVLTFNPNAIQFLDGEEEDQQAKQQDDEDEVVLVSSSRYTEDISASALVAPARSLTTRNVKIPIGSAYTLYMIKDMMRHRMILPSVEEFEAWFVKRYLEPSKRSTNEVFKIPNFNTFSDAIDFMEDFMRTYPDQISVFEDDLKREFLNKRTKGDPI